MNKTITKTGTGGNEDVTFWQVKTQNRRDTYRVKEVLDGVMVSRWTQSGWAHIVTYENEDADQSAVELADNIFWS